MEAKGDTFGFLKQSHISEKNVDSRAALAGASGAVTRTERLGTITPCSKKKNKVPQANRGQDRRRVRVTELDFGFSCTECTENGGRTSKAGFSASVCYM